MTNYILNDTNEILLKLEMLSKYLKFTGEIKNGTFGSVVAVSEIE